MGKKVFTLEVEVRQPKKEKERISAYAKGMNNILKKSETKGGSKA